jgi:uracil-DNA glycosylase
VPVDLLKKEIWLCSICSLHLPSALNPVFQFHTQIKILLVGQAPGQKVQNIGIPFNDKIGDILRYWLGVSEEQFYDECIFAIMPMGFYFPGKGKSGDVTLRKCAPQWHSLILKRLKSIYLIILIEQFAQHDYLGKKEKENLKETVIVIRNICPGIFHWCILRH